MSTKRAKLNKDGIEVKLDVEERFIFNKLCPPESDILTQVIVADIRKKVAFSQAEIKKFGMTFPPGQIKWSIEKAKAVKISFTKVEIELLKTQILEMDKKKKITQQILTLVLKIKDL